MDLMAEGVARGMVLKTALTHKLTIDGQTLAYPVYRIRIDQLHYNPQNDRIATWMSQYREEHDGQMPDASNLEAYNTIVESFIVASNPDAIKQTANNIRLYDQRVPGIVLSNGLIIDGNRRFTCLRRLARDDPKFTWIEMVILPESIAADPKRIKILELAIQHGEEGKVDYNPVDRLVGVYNDVLKSRLLTPEEYARSTNTPVVEVNKMMREARLMVDFLGFANAQGKFHLARELAVSGPIKEIPAILKNCADEDEEEVVKNCIFANMLVEPKGDITRYVRRFKGVLKSPAAKDFIAEEADIAADVVDKLASVEEVTVSTIREEIRGDTALANRFNDALERADSKAKGARLMAAPVENLQSALELMERVDVMTLAKLPQEDVDRAIKAIGGIERLAEEIRGAVAEA